MTKPQSPKFTKTNSKPLERGYLNEGDPSLSMADKLGNALMKRAAGLTGGSFNKTAASADGEDKAAMNPSSTKSMTHLMNRRREELEEKRKNDEVKRKEDRERDEKQNRVRPSST